LIDTFNVFSRVLSMVFFKVLRSSSCFPSEKKTYSIPPPDPG
jgi:hypothetical protein